MEEETDEMHVDEEKGQGDKEEEEPSTTTPVAKDAESRTARIRTLRVGGMVQGNSHRSRQRKTGLSREISQIRRRGVDSMYVRLLSRTTRSSPGKKKKNDPLTLPLNDAPGESGDEDVRVHNQTEYMNRVEKRAMRLIESWKGVGQPDLVVSCEALKAPRRYRGR